MSGRVRLAVLLLAAFVFSWAISRAFAETREDGVRPARAPIAPPTQAQYDSATHLVQGRLTAAAAESVRSDLVQGEGLLVVLRAEDVRTCEDLGRQLRELQGRFPSLPMVVAGDSVSADLHRTFLRRERVRAAVRSLDARNVLDGTPALRTPAVLVLRDGGGAVTGVAHPRRFANARIRSFADELTPDLQQLTSRRWTGSPTTSQGDGP